MSVSEANLPIYMNHYLNAAALIKKNTNCLTELLDNDCKVKVLIKYW